MKWNELVNVLQRPIAFHRIFAEIGGGVCAGVFLSQAFYWTPRTKDPEGWFYKTAEEWKEETGLTRYELETVRKNLKSKKLIEEKKRGIPGKMHYRLIKENILKAIEEVVEAESLAESQFGENQQTSLLKTSKQDCGKPANKKVENQHTNTKTTSETTETTLSAERENFFEGKIATTEEILQDEANSASDRPTSASRSKETPQPTSLGDLPPEERREFSSFVKKVEAERGVTIRSIKRYLSKEEDFLEWYELFLSSSKNNIAQSTTVVDNIKQQKQTTGLSTEEIQKKLEEI